MSTLRLHVANGLLPAGTSDSSPGSAKRPPPLNRRPFGVSRSACWLVDRLVTPRQQDFRRLTPTVSLVRENAALRDRGGATAQKPTAEM